MKRYKIFVINLDRSPERLKSITEQLDNFNLPFERIPACDGKLLTQEEIDRFYSSKKNRKEYVRPMHTGQIGCYISHAKAWEKILADDLDFAIVLEDDIELKKDFPHALNFLDEHFEEWEFVRLQENAKKKRILFEKKHADFSFVEYINTPGNTAAQAITKSAAKKLLASLIPFGVPVDIQQQYMYKAGVEVSSLHPNVAKMGGISEKSDLISCMSAPKAKSHFPFVRLKLSLVFYSKRIFNIIKKRGFFKTCKVLLALPFKDSVN